MNNSGPNLMKKRLKMAAMTRILFFPNFLKNGCGLGIITTMQYFEY